MSNPLSRSARTVILGVCVTSALLAAGEAQASFPVDLALEPLPQSKHDTCQSYGLAFALAASGDSAYKANTPKELRDLEARVRQHIEKAAKAVKDGNVYQHSVWQAAVMDMTSDKFVLERKEFKSLSVFFEHVESLTGIGNARARGALLSAVTVKEVVLTSVTKLGKNTYDGHIVAVVGLHKGPANVSSPAGLAVINPGIQASGTKVSLCSAQIRPGDLSYTAGFSIENEYILKTFDPGNGSKYFVAMYLRRK